MRLCALRESPAMFLASYERECGYDEAKWRAELKRGEWVIGTLDDNPVSLVGITYEESEKRRYIEYMWVAPRFRRSGIATRMLDFVLDRLYKSGVQEIYLWVLDGNEPAAHLYKRMGFVSTNVVNWLDEKPGRREEQLALDLSAHGS